MKNTVLKIKDNKVYTAVEGEKNVFSVKGRERIRIDGGMSKFLDRIANKTLPELEKNELNKSNSKVFLFPDVFINRKEREDDKDEEKVYILKTFKDGSKGILTSISTQLTGNLIGFLGQGKQQLIIKSRFDSDSDNYFLFYMLSRALKIPFVHSFELSKNAQERMIEYYIFLFPYYFRMAMKKGPYKTYVKRQYNDANVKGVIDVQRHINHNTPFAGRIAYHQREFSYDNHLMELIRHTIEYIKHKYGNDLFSGIKEYVSIIEELTPGYDKSKRIQIIRENKNNIVRSKYYSDYKKLQDLCLCILEYKRIGLSGDSDNQIYGVLFDASWIWEEYVNTLINEEFYHPQNKEKKGTQYLFKKWNIERDVQEIYPDFIGKDPTRRMIADAKYKPISNIGRNDYFQVLAYMLRFDSALGYYLYPSTKEEKADERFEIPKGVQWSGVEESLERRKDGDKLIVIKHGLVIPKSSGDFREFELQMRKNERTFVQELLDARD